MRAAEEMASSSEDAETKLQTYRQQLAQVEAAIAQDPDNPEWSKLRQDLVEVIQLTSELAQVRATTVKDEELRTYSLGEKCQAIFEQDGSWYNAKIVSLAEDGYFVTFVGYGNTAQVDFNEVRQYQRPDTSGWQSGTECSAVHPSDGRWYDATLLEVRAATVVVNFKAETEQIEVDIDFCKMRKASDKRKAEEEAKAIAAAAASTAVPKSLEVQPDDSEEQALKKKKKLKMFKRQEKKEAEVVQGETRRSGWQNFSTKNKTIKKSKNNHDPNWDPTRDHGELAARVQMEKYSMNADR